MKVKKLKSSSLVLTLIATLMNGCSWFFETSTEATNDSYEAGNIALTEGKYDEATKYFRQISPSSPFYPQAIWMIQKVPFRKGVSAYKQKKYQIAIDELSKVPVHSNDYDEAKRYIKLTKYNLLREKYLKSSSKDRFYIIKDLVDISNELGNSKLLLENFALVENELKKNSSKKKTKYLINLIWRIVELSDDTELNKRTLNYLLGGMGNFYKEPEIRTLVFQIIGNLKIELM